jgi:hypothetical protein
MDRAMQKEVQANKLPDLTLNLKPLALTETQLAALRRLPNVVATGARSERDRNRGIGYDYLHCVVDDHSRLAYVELHPREDA